MYLTEEHVIDKSHNLWKECDRLCFASKNLYNFTLYNINKEFEISGKLISFNNLYHLLKSEDCFKALPNDISKQVLMQVQRSWMSFFKALKSYKKDKTRFNSCPRPPKYKNKLSGRNVITIINRCCRLKDNTILFNKHLSLILKTKVSNLVEVKISPQSNCYKIGVCYKQDCLANIQSDNKIAIDLGINNLCTITNNFNKQPIIINGKELKSVNKHYNKIYAKSQSQLKKNHNKYTSNYLKSLTKKRNNKVKHFLHHVSKLIITYCTDHNVSEIIIGYNSQWKHEVNLGSKTNQTFVQIPFFDLINQIKYKGELQGISVLLNEESYTSKCSALDLEEIKKHEEYKGKRIKRGLFKTEKGLLVNSDVNGSLNIGRKVFGNDFINLSDIGCVTQPLKVNPL